MELRLSITLTCRHPLSHSHCLSIHFFLLIRLFWIPVEITTF